MLKDATAVLPKFDREAGVDCPNAILVLVLHIQELWMDIMPQTLIYSVSHLTVTIKRLAWELNEISCSCMQRMDYILKFDFAGPILN